MAQDSEHGIIGFGSAGRARGDAPYQGEVFTLYVHPDCQGQGIGQRLLSGLFDGLRERGMNSAVVWVLAMNPARFFYEPSPVPLRRRPFPSRRDVAFRGG